MLLFLADAVSSREGTGGLLPILLIIAAVFYFVKIHPTNKYRKKTIQLRSESESIDKFTVVDSEEKIIEAKITSNKLTRALLIAGIGLIVLGIIIGLSVYSTGDGFHNFGYGNYGIYPYTVLYDSFGDFFSEMFFDPTAHAYDNGFVIAMYAGILSTILALFFKWEMSKCELTVTNRRVTGKASFGKSVDLPLNQISAVGLGIFSRITVATSSGRIHFWFIKNRAEVHSALTEVIGKVQVEAVYSQKNAPAASNADELKKYKELLDSGVISQEEFDAKKKQLLGL